MQDDSSQEPIQETIDRAADPINPYAATPRDVEGRGQQSDAPNRPFAAAGWEYVRDGLVLVVMGYFAALAAYALLLVLGQYGPQGKLVGVGLLLLAALVVLAGKWMCRGAPRDSGLQDPITVACLAFSYQWLGGIAIGVLHHWFHFGNTTLGLVRFSTTVAELIGMGCFLSFLVGVAQKSADERLVRKAKFLFNSFLLFYSLVVLSRLMSWRSTGHFEHHSHVVHHLRPFGTFVALGVGLPLFGALVAWLVSYISLIKSLADKIDEQRH